MVLRSIVAVVRARTHLSPNDRAMADSTGRALTFAQLGSGVSAVRDGIRDVIASSPQRRVALVFPRADWLEFAQALIGVSAAGHVPVPVEYHPDRFEKRLSRIGPAAVVWGGSWQVFPDGFDAAPDHFSFAELTVGGPIGGAEADASAERDGIASLLFTSGTFSRERKLIEYTNHDVIPPKLDVARARRTGVHSLFPPHSAAGAHGILLGDLVRNTLSVASGTSRPHDLDSEVLQLVRDIDVFRPSVLTVPPVVLTRLVDRGLLSAEGGGLGGLRYIKFGGAPLPPRTGAAVLESLPRVRIISLYAATEGGRAVVPALWHPDTSDVVGRSSTTGEVMIRTRDGGVGTKDDPQEIFIRPDHSGAGVSVVGQGGGVHVEDGWVSTGDVGYVDDSGRVRLSGRRKEILVLRDGMKLNASSVELAVEKHPSVAAAALIAQVSDDKFSDLAVVFVKPREGMNPPGWERLADQVGLSPQLRARVALISELPLTSTGKVDKAELLHVAEPHLGPGDFDSTTIDMRVPARLRPTAEPTR